MLASAGDGLAVFDVLIRVLHIGAALAVGGGALFQWWAVHPALATLDDARRVELREALVARWRVIVWSAIGLLLLTGLLNFVLNKIPELKPHPQKGIYHGLFGLKFVLALAAFHAGAVLTLPGPKGARYRANGGFWLMLLVAYIAAIVLLGAILRDFNQFFPAAG